MIIAILILICWIFFISLLILGEVVLIKKKLYQKQAKARELPQVQPEVLRTMAGVIERMVRKGSQKREGGKWADEFISEQPSLSLFLKTVEQQDFSSVVTVVVMYKLLKAQLEADSLADLTKIEK